MKHAFGVSLLLAASTAGAQVFDHGSTIEHDSTVAREEPGTHNGGGMSTGYSFFRSAPGFEMVFRKRALHPGAAIGYHEQKEDEVYYILSGRGEFTLDGTRHEVGPGVAMLTRPGSSHGIRTLGSQDLVLLIAYPVRPRTPKP